jgi:hypothetical protein
VDEVDHVHDQDAVPLAGCQAAPSTETATALTPTLSELVPDTVTVPAAVEPARGAEMLIDGAVVSRHLLPLQVAAA